MNLDELCSAPIERLRELAPTAIANARWVAVHPAEAIRDLEFKIAIGSSAPPCRLDEAWFPWFRFGVESMAEGSYWKLAGREHGPTTLDGELFLRDRTRRNRELIEEHGFENYMRTRAQEGPERIEIPQTRDVLVADFFAGGRWLGEIVLEGRHYLDSDPDLRPLILWAEYVVGLGESAIAGTAGGDKPRFREPKRGLSKKAAAVREILIDAWPEVRTGPEIVSELDKRGLDETTAHLSDRIFPELEEAGCPVVNLGRGYYLLPSFVGN
jgi:hypothetical protein